MKSKKNILIGTLIIFLLSFFTHNTYTIFPNFLTSLLFPVNESIWEHTKMIFTTWIIFSPIEYFYLKKYNSTNVMTAIFLGLFTNIILLLLIFTPIYFLMNKQDNLILTLLIYFISIFISMILNYYIINKNIININKISIISIIILFIIYGVLTYYPINNPLFYDYFNNIIGIKKS